MTASTDDKKLLFASLLSFVTGSVLVYLHCWLISPSCIVRVYKKTSGQGNNKVYSDFEAREILRPLRKEEERPLPSSPVFTGDIGEKPCECAGSWHKDLYSAKEWPKVERRQRASLERYERRRKVFNNVHNNVDGFSPITYPSHGITVRPLRAVLLDGIRIRWLDSRDIITNATFTIRLQCARGIFRLLSNVSNVEVQGKDTNAMNITTSVFFSLNRQLRGVVYQNTEFHTNAFDMVDLRYKTFNATIPIHIHHRQIPWLYEQGSGRFRDRVSVVVKTFLRYGNLRRLIWSVRELYPGTRIIVADDTPHELLETFQDDNIDHYMMPEYKGFFAGRNLGLSQVTTEYFLYMDDDHYLKHFTKLEVLVALLDRTDFHVVGGVYEDLPLYATTIRVLGNSSHACYEKLRANYHMVPGFPGCYAVDHTENFFLASTAEVKAVGFDPHRAQSREAHQEFFTAALGRLRIAVCGNIIVGHNKTTDSADNKLYEKQRQTHQKYKTMKVKHYLFKDNLTCIGVKYPRNESIQLKEDVFKSLKKRREAEGASLLKNLDNKDHPLHNVVYNHDES